MLDRIARIGPQRNQRLALADAGGARPGQASILAPPQPLTRGDRQNVLDLALTERLSRDASKLFPQSNDKRLCMMFGMSIKHTGRISSEKSTNGTRHQLTDHRVAFTAMDAQPQRGMVVKLDHDNMVRRLAPHYDATVCSGLVRHRQLSRFRQSASSDR